MREVPFIGSVIRPACNVGGGAGPDAPADEHGWSCPVFVDGSSLGTQSADWQLLSKWTGDR